MNYFTNRVMKLLFYDKQEKLGCPAGFVTASG